MPGAETFPWAQIRLLAFDLDGTLYMGDEAIPGAVAGVQELRRTSKVVYFTNNSTKTIEELAGKMVKLGFPCGPGDMYSSAAETAEYCVRAGLDDLYVIGSAGLRSELERRGLSVREAGLARHLVVGLDLEFNYAKIAEALWVLMRGGRFIACNEDRNFPSSGGRLMPGCGAMVGAISMASGRRPDHVGGKPDTGMLDRISRDHVVTADQIVVVGDSYDSDIAMALQYNAKAVLIGREAPADPRIWLTESVAQLVEAKRRQQ